MRLIIKNPTFKDSSITALYDYNGNIYKHEFIAPVKIPKNDRIATILINWLAVIHSIYLFSIEYFDEIETDFSLTTDEILFFEKIIFHGMAEFRYVNKIKIDKKTKIISAATTSTPCNISSHQYNNGALLLNGGGKDGLTSAILMNKAGIEYDLFQIGTGVSQSRVSKALNKIPYIFKRIMEPQRYNQKYNGHRPTSAAIAISSVFCAYLLKKAEVIASNENSANEPNLFIEDVTINHQYSKTYEFETDFSKLLEKHNINVKYFSLLRPLHELQIIKIFSKEPAFYKTFTSCNHGFRKGTWCLECAKCAFINLCFTAVEPSAAKEIFGIEDSINKKQLSNYIISLVEKSAIKPFECVGNLFECQIAAKLILKNPEICLSEDLKKAFVKNTKNISNYKIKNFFESVQQSNNIPKPKYNELINIMESILKQS